MSNTVPIETRMARRYHGSQHVGSSSRAWMPSAAALRKIAPMFSWSLMPSSTATTCTLASSAVEVWRWWPVRRGEHTAVDVEARDRVHHRLRRDVDGHRRASQLIGQRAERGPPPVGHERGPKQWWVAEQTLDDERSLGDAHTIALDRSTERGVVERAVIGDARVVRIVDGRRRAHVPGSVAHSAEVLTTRLRGAGSGVARLRRVAQPCLVRAAGRRGRVARQRAVPSSRRHRCACRRAGGSTTAALHRRSCSTHPRTRRRPHRLLTRGPPEPDLQ